MRELRKHISRVSNREIWTALSISVLGLACSGAKVHKDLSADSNIMSREWTIPTHKEFAAGDRGFEYSNPTISQNTLVFGNQSIGLVAIYPMLNQTRWVLPIPGGVTSELAIEKNSIFFGGGDGFFYSVNLDTGRVNWRYDVRQSRLSRPTVSGGRVFVTTADDTVYAFDAGSGEWIWHYKRRSGQNVTVLGASRPLVDGQELLVGTSDGHLVGLNIQDGKVKWEKRLHESRKFMDVDATPVLSENVIYVPSYDGSLYALSRSGREVLWKIDTGGSKQVAIESGKIYLPSSDGHVYCFQKASGKENWKFELDGGTPTEIVLTDKYLIVGSSHQYLYVLDKTNGKPLYRYDVGYGTGFSGAPGYDSKNGRYYILSGGGNLYAFSVNPPTRKIKPFGQIDPYEF